MAEPTLSLTRDDLRGVVGLKLGYGLDTSGWQPEQIARIDICVRDGMGNFYLPVLPEEKEIYEWSFLRLTATITLTGSQTEDDLPEDCDGAIEKFIVTAGDGTATVIPVIPVSELLKLRAANVSTAIPKYAAIRVKATDPTTSQSQRLEVMWYPTPDAGDTVSYEYPVRVDTIGTTNTYLPGGASHSQTIVASCLAVAEQYLEPDEQAHREAFMQRLTASVQYDKRNQSTQQGTTWDVTEPTYGTWDWFKREVSGYLFNKWDLNLLTHSENAQVESLVQRGLKSFYFPPGMKRCWSFLVESARITLGSGTAAYDLPAGFTGLHGKMTYVTPAAGAQPLRQIDEDELRAMQTSDATSLSPEYVCIREKTSTGVSAHAGTSAFLYEAVFFPTPDATESIQYRYKGSPPVLSSSVTFPHGADVHAETMRQAMIFHAAEQKPDGNQQEESQKFQQKLAASMVADVDVDLSDYEMSPPQPQAEAR